MVVKTERRPMPLRPPVALICWFSRKSATVSSKESKSIAPVWRRMTLPGLGVCLKLSAAEVRREEGSESIQCLLLLVYSIC